MIQASIKAELHDKIMKMENKYDTIVGERGTKLSIGEKQRICIARCFLKDSKIIVLDEHASNLDNENKKSYRKGSNQIMYGENNIYYYTCNGKPKTYGQNYIFLWKKYICGKPQKISWMIITSIENITTQRIIKCYNQ